MWQEDRGRVQNEEVFQKSVLTGTAVVTKPLNPSSVRAHALTREYSRLISRKNMPVCVCVCAWRLLLRTLLWHRPMLVLCSVWLCRYVPQPCAQRPYGPPPPKVSVMRLSTPHWSQLIVQYWAACVYTAEIINNVVDNKQHLFMSMYLKMNVFSPLK